MKFIIKEMQEIEKRLLVYREEEYSFDIEPHDGTGYTSILINDLQLEINDIGKLLYVWGLCPLNNFQNTDEFPKKYQTKNIFANLENAIIPGVSYKLNELERWPIYINKKNGWVCIGNPTIENQKLIEFAPNCILAINELDAVALWLLPKYI